MRAGPCRFGALPKRAQNSGLLLDAKPAQVYCVRVRDIPPRDARNFWGIGLKTNIDL